MKLCVICGVQSSDLDKLSEICPNCIPFLPKDGKERFFSLLTSYEKFKLWGNLAAIFVILITVGISVAFQKLTGNAPQWIILIFLPIYFISFCAVLRKNYQYVIQLEEIYKGMYAQIDPSPIYYSIFRKRFNHFKNRTKAYQCLYPLFVLIAGVLVLAIIRYI